MPNDVVKLAPERKLLTNLLKMVAYQAESDLVHRVAPHYKRTTDEGRTLIQAALASPADLEVTEGELRILSHHSVPLIERGCSPLSAKNSIVTAPSFRAPACAFGMP